MHPSAFETGRRFFHTYVVGSKSPSVIEIGSQNVNGCLRDVASPNVREYVGVDFVEGNGVDVILKDAYKYPFEDNQFDFLVTSSCFEHSEMFWLSFLEGMRVLKEEGVMYINAPSSWMSYHRYPVDCWRFYPDAGKGLETWARHCGLNSMVLESYISPPGRDEFVSDFVCVIVKDADHADKYPTRMIDTLEDGQGFFNGFRFPKTDRFPDGWDAPRMQIKQDIILPKREGLVIR